jgi:hypothetical protein
MRPVIETVMHPGSQGNNPIAINPIPDTVNSDVPIVDHHPLRILKRNPYENSVMSIPNNINPPKFMITL